MVSALTEDYQTVEVGEIPALFSNALINRDTVPKGLYCYDIRSDDALANPATIEKHVLVNHFGSLISKKPIPLGDDGRMVLGEEQPNVLNFTGDTSTIEEYTKK